jgi:eukaryotic-like serine/threonine-protein kinase
MAGTTRQLTGKRKQPAKTNQRAQLQPGDMLQNRYRIMGTLGVGGFSSVYQARDMRFTSATRLCAIKEMVNIGGNPEVRELARRSFETEASILATLDHIAIPRVFDYFSEGDRSYLVMEYIRGKDLEGALEERNDPIEPDLAVDWALQVCDVLAYLHSHKPTAIVFRDLKPSNIMLDQQGRIRLIDFGIAKHFQGDAKGTMIGTEGYSPPEQYRGESSPAGDVYALGATLHHLLTMKDPRLEPPFSWQERPISEINPRVSPQLNQIVMRCLSYAAKDRYEDAMTLREALQGLSRGSSVSAMPAMGDNRTAVAPPSSPANQPPPATASPYATPTMPDPTPMGQQAQQWGAPAIQQTSLQNSIEPLWVFRCEDEIRSKPAVMDNTVYVGAYDNNLYALNTADGAFRWKYPATDGIASSPAVFKNDVYIGSVDQHVYSINRHTGKMQWRFETKGPVYSSPTAEFEYVFFGSDDQNLYAVNINTALELWKSPSHGPIRSSPRITDKYIYYGTEGGYVFALDMRGAMKWQFQAKRGVTSSPAYAEDMVFVGSLDATVYGLDANSGWAVWRTRTARPVISSPVVHEGIVYIGSSDGKLHALDMYSGRQVWSYQTDGQVNSSPAVLGEAVYFGSTDGYVYSISTKRGKLRWRYKTGGYVISSPVIADNKLFIGSCDHNFYAFPA